MSFKYGTREWLFWCATNTGTPWCEWPENFSKSKSVCRTCVSYFGGKKTFRDTLQHKQHVEKQKKLIESMKTKKTNKSIIGIQTSAKIKIGKYLKQIHEDDKILKKKEIPKVILTPKEELKMKGQYCTYHHSCYNERRCICSRDREGLLKWYDSYDRQKQCIKCDSLECDCPRTKEGNIIKKIVVKEVYEQEDGKCQIHNIKNGKACDCADSIKCLITETFDGKNFHKYCTLHRDKQCECDKNPKFYKIIKQVPEGGWNYDYAYNRRRFND